ncbi:hypothetical protein [Streptomyces sp. NBC_00083]|uniref:hypothetical protein n=1 Tax=Streptomyces sp. NBC_00083 TaxID=2975647 RepID=UPI0022585E10|nr:hypothetical protein [Streptomyces sp. NBC_00083]MCX5385778.1 hypothetical protein [Streptomyces sp. NBC_00083]
MDGEGPSQEEVDGGGPSQEEKHTWIATCGVRYCVTFGIGWIVTAAVGPPGSDPHHPEAWVAMSRWASFKDYLSAGPGMFLMIGIPSLIILIVVGLRCQRMPSEQIRVMTGFMLLLPLWFLLFAGGALVVLVQGAFQCAFAAVMPAPLDPRAD